MEPGAVVAERYRLERLLGRGGMGSVWAAAHVVTGRRVALKLLAPGGDERARRRVLREARAACAVRHPNVVAVHDVIEAEDGSPVLVMDLLEGESLRDKLDRERKLPLAETLGVARTVLSALEVAHAAGIVHRDLKPDNLFVLPSGELKILDFGVAKLEAHDGFPGASGTLTATGAMVGTPYYMAPEQAFGEEVDGRSDLWALGIVIYECLAGQPPTHAENLGQILRKLTTGDLVPLAERVPETPRAIAALVSSLLSIERDHRPPSARAVLEALEAAEKAPNEPAPAPAPAVGPVAEAPVGRTQTADGSTRSIAPSAANAPRRTGVATMAIGAIAAAAMGTAAFIGMRGRDGAASAGEAASTLEPDAAAPVIAASAPTAEPSVVVEPGPPATAEPTVIASATASASAKSAAAGVPTPGRSPRATRTAAAPAPAASAPAAPTPGTKLLTTPPF